MTNYIAMPGLDRDCAGLITWWRLSGNVDCDAFAIKWVVQGGDERALPSLPTLNEALLRALRAVAQSDEFVRPLPKGYAIIREYLEGNDKKFTTVCKVALGEGGLEFEVVEVPKYTDTPRYVETIRAAFELFKTTYVTTDISTWLSRIMREVQAVPLRDTGGVYFVPQAKVNTFTRIVEAIHASSNHYVSTVPALRSTEAVEAISRSLAAEITADVNALQEVIQGGDLGARALKSRFEKSEALVQKVRLYEQVLDVTQKTLLESLEELQANITVAITFANAASDEAKAK